MQPKIIAIGVDLCSLNRFEKHLENKEFLAKVFSASELTSAFLSIEPSSYLAKCWAAKESLIKALKQSIFSFNLPLLQANIVQQQWQLGEEIDFYLKSLSITEVVLAIEQEFGMAIAKTVLKGFEA